MPLIPQGRHFGLVPPMTIKVVGFCNRQQSGAPWNPISMKEFTTLTRVIIIFVCNTRVFILYLIM